MAAQSEIREIQREFQSEFHKLRDEAFKKLPKDDYTKLTSDPDLLKKAEAAMKETYDELKYMMDHTNSLDDALGHLSQERQQLIKTSLRLQSFQADIEHHSDGSATLRCVSLAGQPLTTVPTAVIISPANQHVNRILLIARIVYEIFVLFLNLVGIHLHVSEDIMEEALDRIINMLNSHAKILEDVNDMIDAQDKGDNMGVAKAIISCIFDLFAIGGADGGDAMDIVKILLKDMPWYDVVITIAKVSLFVTTLVAAPGVALFARVLLWLLDASSFIRKLVQLNEFNKLYK